MPIQLNSLTDAEKRIITAHRKLKDHAESAAGSGDIVALQHTQMIEVITLIIQGVIILTRAVAKALPIPSKKTLK